MPPVNPYNKYIKQYQANNINTATPEKLMILLFDGALQFLQKAKTAIAEGDLQEKAQNIESARKIIRELMRTIDLENGNDISKHLYLFYNRQINNLTKVSIHRDLELLKKITQDLTDIRNAFIEAIKIVNQDLSKSEQEEERLRYEAELNTEDDSEESGHDYGV